LGGTRALPRLVVALRFLTVVPVPGRARNGPAALGSAAWWFPPVGLALGLVLAGADHVTSRLFPPLLSAALVVALWKILTGGLHLDGLADCLDGLAGRDIPHRLAIMRDSRIGVFGAVGVMLAVVLSLAALAGLAGRPRASALLLAPVVGRLAPLLAGAIFPAAPLSTGAGAAFMGSLPRAAGLLEGTVVMILAGLVLGPRGVAMVATGLGAAMIWSAIVVRRVGGLTGDGLGAGVELAELGVLVAASADVGLGGG
jgi:adenosylcobinamide-GDP ribazoletransferase